MSAVDMLQLALRIEDCKPSGKNEYILKRCFHYQTTETMALVVAEMSS